MWPYRSNREDLVKYGNSTYTHTHTHAREIQAFSFRAYFCELMCSVSVAVLQGIRAKRLVPNVIFVWLDIYSLMLCL